MEHLRAEYTEIWVRSDTVSLVRFADRVRAISSTGLDLLGLPDVEPPPELVLALGSFDEIVTWYGANRPEFREALGSFGKNVRFLPALPVGGTATGHAADFFLQQAGGTGTAIPNIDAGHEERRPAIVLHPFSGSERKNWPLERFEQLERAYPVEWAARPGQVRFADLYELAKWLAGASLYVGNDSGITHLAAAVGTPTIALFGPTDPDVWGPRGTGVRIVRERSMEDISTGVVRAAIDREWDRTRRG